MNGTLQTLPADITHAEDNLMRGTNTTKIRFFM